MNANLIKGIFSYLNFEDHFYMKTLNKKIKDLSDSCFNEKWEKKVQKQIFGENFYKYN